MTHLTSADISKKQLQQYSSAIVDLKKQSITPERIWRYGQPAIDGIVVQGRLAGNDAANLAEIIKHPNLRGIEVFPLGIPFPDFLELRIKIGEQIQQYTRS